jgi:purine-binding chemotaxis protein CheW
MSGVHVRVRIGGEDYALPVEQVVEATDVGDVTPVPGAPREMLGVRNLRGQVLPVVELGLLLGLGEAREAARLVIAEDGDRRAGLVVESIVAVGELPDATHPAASALVAGAALVDGDLVGVLDLAAALDAIAPESGA